MKGALGSGKNQELKTTFSLSTSLMNREFILFRLLLLVFWHLEQCFVRRFGVMQYDLEYVLTQVESTKLESMTTLSIRMVT